MTESSQPRWLFWVLGGCLLVILLGVAGAAGVYYWGKNRLTALVEEQTDPVKREQNLRKMLGAQKLPPGYHAGVNRDHHPLLRRPRALGSLVPARPAGHADGGDPAARQRGRRERHPTCSRTFASAASVASAW